MIGERVTLGDHAAIAFDKEKKAFWIGDAGKGDDFF